MGQQCKITFFSFFTLGMGVLKAVGYAVSLLAIYYGLVHRGYRETLNAFLKVRLVIIIYLYKFTPFTSF